MVDDVIEKKMKNDFFSGKNVVEFYAEYVTDLNIATATIFYFAR